MSITSGFIVVRTSLRLAASDLLAPWRPEHYSLLHPPTTQSSEARYAIEWKVI